MPRLHVPRYVQAVRAKGRTYYYFRRPGVRWKLDGAPGEAAFHASYAAALRRMGEDPAPARWGAGTVGAMITAYRASPAWATLAPGTRTSYDRALAKLEPILGFPAADIRRRHITAIRDTMTATPRTRHMFGQVASAVWNWAIAELDLDTINPAAKLKREDGAVARVAWSPEQLAAFEASSPPRHVMTAYMIARYAGPRRGDVVAMMRSHYDGTRLIVAGAKTRSPQRVPAHPALARHLDALPPTLYLVADDKGRPVSASRLGHDMRAHLDAIGLHGLSLHGLRHTAGMALAEAGCSAHEIAAVLGHRTLQMVERYTRTARQERLAGSAIARLARTERDGNV